MADLKWDNLEIVAEEQKSVSVKQLNADTFTVTYTIRPDSLPIGSYKDDLQIRPRMGDKIVDSGLQFPVTGHINSDVQVSPQGIFLGAIGHEEKDGRFIVSTADHKKIRLLSFTTPGCLEVKLAIQEADRLEFVYKSVKTHETGRISGRIVINLLADKKRTITMPVMAFAE